MSQTKRAGPGFVSQRCGSGSVPKMSQIRNTAQRSGWLIVWPQQDASLPIGRLLVYNGACWSLSYFHLLNSFLELYLGSIFELSLTHIFNTIKWKILLLSFFQITLRTKEGAWNLSYGTYVFCALNLPGTYSCCVWEEKKIMLKPIMAMCNQFSKYCFAFSHVIQEIF